MTGIPFLCEVGATGSLISQLAFQFQAKEAIRPELRSHFSAFRNSFPAISRLSHSGLSHFAAKGNPCNTALSHFELKRNLCSTVHSHFAQIWNPRNSKPQIGLIFCAEPFTTLPQLAITSFKPRLLREISRFGAAGGRICAGRATIAAVHLRRVPNFGLRRPTATLRAFVTPTAFTASDARNARLRRPSTSNNNLCKGDQLYEVKG